MSKLTKSQDKTIKPLLTGVKYDLQEFKDQGLTFKVDMVISEENDHMWLEDHNRIVVKVTKSNSEFFNVADIRVTKRGKILTNPDQNKNTLSVSDIEFLLNN